MRCKICWEEEEAPGKLQAPSAGNRLISPCRCKGTVRWVHVTCLRHWRAAHSPSDDSFKRCLLCGTNYQMKWKPLAKVAANPHALQGIALVLTLGALICSCSASVRFSGIWLPVGASQDPMGPPNRQAHQDVLIQNDTLPLTPTPLEILVCGMTLLSFASYLLFNPHLALLLTHLLRIVRGHRAGAIFLRWVYRHVRVGCVEGLWGRGAVAGGQGARPPIGSASRHGICKARLRQQEQPGKPFIGVPHPDSTWYSNPAHIIPEILWICLECLKSTNKYTA